MAGSVTVTKHRDIDNGKGLIVKLACIGDAANGSVPSTQITNAALNLNGYWQYQNRGMVLQELVVVDGSPVPDAADISITDEDSFVLFTEANVIPVSGSKAGTIATPKLITSLITVAVANQATVNAQWAIYLKLVKARFLA